MASQAATELLAVQPVLILTAYQTATDLSMNAFTHTCLNLSGAADGALSVQAGVVPVNPDVAVTPGTGLTATAPTIGTKTLTKATNRGVYNKTVNTQLANSAIRVEAQMIAQGAGALYQVIDTAIGALYASAASTIDAGLNDLAETDIVNAKKALDLANAPKNRRVLTVNETQMAALTKIPRFTEADKIGSGQAIIEGAVGKVHGFNVFMDINVTDASSQSRNLAYVAPPNVSMTQGIQNGYGETGFGPDGSPSMMGDCSMSFAVGRIPAPPVVISVQMPFGNLVISHDVSDDSNEIRLNAIYGVLMQKTEWVVGLAANA